ncbi:MAG: hypothetical protein KAT43_04910 [Nanoarchaeota archaeon]|nr:hypothetical protein [Nanoarchaeota archaeon]
MYEKQLRELGLTDNEVRLYLALLQHGLLNPYELAEKTGLHRGYIYDALERMQEKGVINSIMKGKKKYFQATSPENLAELLRMKLESFQSIVPDLNKLMLTEKEDTEIELHKGKKVWRTLMKDILTKAKKGDEILYFGINEDVLAEVEPIYIEKYFNIMHRKGWKEKAIVRKGARKLKVKNVEYKEIDPAIVGNTTQVIYRDKVAFFIAGTPYYLIIVKNNQVTDTHRKQFEHFWKIAE